MEKLKFVAKKEYTVDEVITEESGGCLRTEFANDCKLNRHVVLKEISYQNANQKKVILKEIENQVMLERYTNRTPKIYNVFEDEKNQIVVVEMQKMEGRTLREILSAEVSKTKDSKWYHDTYELFLNICESVAEIHKVPTGGKGTTSNFVHKDLKPENIMISRGRRHDSIYILDFGISGPGMSKGIGTPIYMAPEQHSGVMKYDVTQATDVYALGQIGIEMFTGEPFIYGEDIIFNTRGDIWLKEKDLTGIGSKEYPRLASVLKKAIAMNPSDRFSNAGKLSEALRSGRGGRYGRG